MFGDLTIHTGQPRSQMPVPPANMAAGCNQGFPNSQGRQMLVDLLFVCWGFSVRFWIAQGDLIADKEVVNVF